jgi:hypothetical protein
MYDVRCLMYDVKGWEPQRQEGTEGHRKFIKYDLCGPLRSITHVGI